MSLAITALAANTDLGCAMTACLAAELALRAQHARLQREQRAAADELQGVLGQDEVHVARALRTSAPEAA